MTDFSLKEKEILIERAKRLAMRPADERDDQQSIKFVHIRLGRQETYGIPLQLVDSIIYLNNLCKVPNSPDIVIGLVNWRGRMLPVIDVKHLFNKTGPAMIEDESRIVVASADGITLGILADEVYGVDDYTPQTLTPSLSAGDLAADNIVHGIANGTITILNISACFNIKKLRTV